MIALVRRFAVLVVLGIQASAVAVTLENPHVQVSIDPRHGGAVVRIVHKRGIVLPLIADRGAQVDGQAWNRSSRCWFGDRQISRWMFTPYGQGTTSQLSSDTVRPFWRVIGQYGTGFLYRPAVEPSRRADQRRSRRAAGDAHALGHVCRRRRGRSLRHASRCPLGLHRETCFSPTAKA